MFNKFFCMQHYLWKKLKMVACHAVIQSMPILYELKTPHVKYWKLKTCQLVKLSICFSFKSVHHMFFLLNNFVLHVCLFLQKKKRRRSPQLINFFFCIYILCTYNLNFCQWILQEVESLETYIYNKKSSTNLFFFCIYILCTYNLTITYWVFLPS